MGHTVVRVDADDAGAPLGLFSTTYVAPATRRGGVASALVRAGEAWLAGRGTTRAVTDTGAHNGPLLRLFQKHGYVVVAAEGEMVRLGRDLAPASG